MTLAFVKTAVANGAVAANYVEMQSFIREGDRITGTVVLDRLSGKQCTIRARVTVNAAGPFIQGINEQHGGLNLARQTTGFSKGVHLVTKKLVDHYAIALPTAKKTEGVLHRGGRHIFILPWRGRSLIGTTNVPFSGKLDEVGVTHEDILDFLEDINQTLPSAQLQLQDVLYAFSGLYPLTAKEIRPDTYQGTGEYQVIDHDQDGVHGAITALGAKYTTARKVAERATDLLAGKLGGSWPQCTTATTQLAGGEIEDWQAFVAGNRRKYTNTIEPELLDSLICHYGTEIDQVVEPLLAGSPAENISQQGILDALVDHAVKYEMACTVADVIFRRTGLGTIGHPGRDIIRAHCRAHGGTAGMGSGQDPERSSRDRDRISVPASMSPSLDNAGGHGLKVLHIAPTPFFADRGCHIRIRNEIESLRDQDVEVTLCTYHQGRDVEGIRTLSDLENPRLHKPWRRLFTVQVSG